MVRQYVEEFAYLFAVFTAFALMYKGWQPLAKTAVSFLPNSGPLAGFKQAVAA